MATAVEFSFLTLSLHCKVRQNLYNISEVPVPVGNYGNALK